MRAIALWAAGLALVASPVVHAQDIYDNSCPIRKELSTAQLTNKIARAIFQVQVKGADGVQRANGTATLIDARGYLLTAGHVIDGYASNGAGAIMLRRYDGLTFEARIVENFLADGLDVAVLVVADFPKNAADPIPLRINSPGGPGAPGAPGSGVVLAYDNSGPAMRNPVKFTLGGYVADTSSMTLGFAAVGGNSGALLLEPSGRAFGLLRDGPDPVAMQMPLYVPETLIPGRNGKFALPEISIEILPEDLQATLLAAGKSRALPISSFWDRLAKAVPPSPQVAEVLNELRATGWRNVVASMDSDGGYHLSTTDLIHLFQAVGQTPG